MSDVLHGLHSDIIGAGIPAGGKDEHFGRLTRGTGFVQIVTSAVLAQSATAEEQARMKEGTFLSDKRVNQLVSAERHAVGESKTVLLNGVGRTKSQALTIHEITRKVAGVLQFVPPEQEEAIEIALHLFPKLNRGETLTPEQEDSIRNNEVYRRMMGRVGRSEIPTFKTYLKRVFDYACDTAPAIRILACEFPLHQVSTAPMPVETQNDARRKAALILGVDGLPAYTQEDEAQLKKEKKAKEEAEAAAKSGTNRHVAA